MITTNSGVVSMTTLTHNGSLSINDFEHRHVRLKTCVKICSNKLTPEIDYQGHRPRNVCQRCFCLNRVCYNFRPVIVDGKNMIDNWCDPCHLNKRSGCSNLTYHESGSGQVPMSHAWLLAYSSDVPVLVFPAWYLLKVLRSRRSGILMTKVYSLDELRIINYSTFGSTTSRSGNTRVGIIAPSEMSSRISLESTQVDSNQVTSGILGRRSKRLAGNAFLATYNELKKEQDELESDSETPDPQLFLESVISSPLVSPPLHPPDQESVSSPSLLSTAPGNNHDFIIGDHNLVFHGGPVIQSGGCCFSTPTKHIDMSDELHINPQFFASNAQFWHGDGPLGQDLNLNLPPPPNSPINIPNGPTLNQDQRGVAELKALNPLCSLFTLPTLESGR
ncbi:hypothetical protein INT45_011403 [Circinella minor]|uniref:Uncharacterized protein n=1 Tax=Circinella minor TaxID=1195481 RepID=A0A8H7SBS0_9FUNG|nr:hypothetical protein INT45_011403 [Circinella minor]